MQALDWLCQLGTVFSSPVPCHLPTVWLFTCLSSLLLTNQTHGSLASDSYLAVKYVHEGSARKVTRETLEGSVKKTQSGTDNTSHISQSVVTSVDKQTAHIFQNSVWCVHVCVL